MDQNNSRSKDPVLKPEVYELNKGVRRWERRDVDPDLAGSKGFIKVMVKTYVLLIKG